MIPERFYDVDEGRFGFNDGDGTVVIAAIFDKAEPFKNGVSIVKKDLLWGAINTGGKTIIPFNFDFIFLWHNNWIHTQSGTMHYLFTAEGKMCLAVDNILSWRYPEAGVIVAKKTSGWGCLDMEGKAIVPFIYKSLGPVIGNRISFFEDTKWGWLDTDGKVFFEPVFDQVGKWDQNYWWARIGDSYMLYDFSGNVICDEGWERILTPNKYMAAVKTAIGWKYINLDFSTRLQLPAGYEWADHFSEGMAPVKKNGLWGFIDSTGKEVIAMRYTGVNAFSEGLAAVRENDLWGFINLEGATEFPFNFIEAGNFIEGKARVKKGLNYCFIDRNNEILYYEDDDYE